jgi:hypothetical protein
MKKIILFFILFVTSLGVYGQSTDYAVLVKTIQPLAIRNDRNELIDARHQISIEKDGLEKYTNGTSETIIDYDFWYLTNDTNPIHYDSFDGSPNNFCRQEYIVPWNLSMVPEIGISGCIADSRIMGIYLPQPGDNRRCIEDVIDLSSGWNWEYRYNGADWVAFSDDFQEQRTISFKIKDLLGFDGKTKIDFRTGYGNQFTKFITYNIIPCSPKVTGTVPVLTSCAYTNDGAVTVNLARELFKGEELVNKSLINEGNVPIQPFFKQINASQFSLSNLAKGSYKFKYQTRMLINGVEANSTPVETTFAINSPSPLQFGLSYSHPKCSTDKGDITITATGGTPPYFYMFGKPDANQVMQYDENTKVQFDPLDNADMSVKIDTLPAGNYTIKVIDKKKCIEK